MCSISSISRESKLGCFTSKEINSNRLQNNPSRCTETKIKRKKNKFNLSLLHQIKSSLLKNVLIQHLHQKGRFQRWSWATAVLNQTKQWPGQPSPQEAFCQIRENPVTLCERQDRILFGIFIPMFNIQLHRGPRPSFCPQANINGMDVYLKLSPPRKVMASCLKEKSFLHHLLKVRRMIPFEQDTKGALLGKLSTMLLT